MLRVDHAEGGITLVCNLNPTFCFHCLRNCLDYITVTTDIGGDVITPWVRIGPETLL